MDNITKLLLLSLLFFFLGLFFWPLIIISALLYFVYLQALKQEIVNTSNAPACPSCLSRHYLVFPKGNKWIFSLKGFVKCSITEYQCQSCQYQWKTYEIEDYD
jgi:hypothetical protein